MPTGRPTSGRRKKARARRTYSDAVKQRAIQQILGGTPASEVATKLDASYGVVHGWVTKRKAAGLNGAAAVAIEELPTEAAVSRPSNRVKALQPTQFCCPHCGGAVSLS